MNKLERQIGLMKIAMGEVPSYQRSYAGLRKSFADSRSRPVDTRPRLVPMSNETRAQDWSRYIRDRAGTIKARSSSILSTPREAPESRLASAGSDALTLVPALANPSQLAILLSGATGATKELLQRGMNEHGVVGGMIRGAIDAGGVMLPGRLGMANTVVGTDDSIGHAITNSLFNG